MRLEIWTVQRLESYDNGAIPEEMRRYYQSHSIQQEIDLWDETIGYNDDVDGIVFGSASPQLSSIDPCKLTNASTRGEPTERKPRDSEGDGGSTRYHPTSTRLD